MEIDINKKYRYRNGGSARVLCVDADDDEPVVSLSSGGDIRRHQLDGSYYKSPENSIYDLIEVCEPREWKAVIIKQLGALASYDEGDENNPDYEVIRVREIID